MLRLLAITPEDGWAFVDSKDGILLVRPPYTRSNSFPVPQRSVGKAIAQHGFSASDREFCQWKELTEFLNAQVREARAARRQQLETHGLGKQILEFASEDVLVTFLNRVESELIPLGLWDPTEQLLLDILNLSRVQKNAELVKRASGLLSRACEGQKKAQTAREALLEEETSLAERFPTLAARFDPQELDAFNTRIIARKQLLPVGE